MDKVITGSDAQRAGRHWVSIAAAMFLFSFCLWKLSETVADPDLWGHLRFGQDTLSSGTIVRSDPYSFMTGGAEWINHEWLSEVVFAFIYGLAGATGLVLTKIIIGLGIVSLVRHELLRHGIPAIRSLFPLIIMAWFLPVSLGTIRPQLFTLAGFALAIWAICRREEGSVRSLWLLPPVFVLWANLHGGFLAGAGIMLLWLASRTFLTIRQSGVSPAAIQKHLRDDALPVAASLLATLANPYGIGLWTFLVSTTAVPRPEITEWSPVTITSTVGVAYLLMLAITGGSILSSHHPRRFTLVIVYLSLALLPLVAVRHITLFSVGAILIAAPYFASAFEQWMGPNRLQKERLLLSISAIMAVLFAWFSVPKLGWIKVDPTCPMPARAVAMLIAARSSAKLATDYNWGEYVIWHAGPRILVSIDGRRETTYSAAAYAENLQFMFGLGRWDALLDDRRPDLALVKQGSPPYNLLQLKPGWSLIYEDPTVALFAAEGSPAAAELRAVASPDLPHDGVGLAFP